MTRKTLFTLLFLTAGTAVTAFALTNSQTTQSGDFLTSKTTNVSQGMSGQSIQGKPMQAGPLDQMASKLKQRLEREPDDMEGWVLLGRTYQYMGKQAEADTAYEKATNLGLSNARLDDIRQGMNEPRKSTPDKLFPAQKSSRNLTAVMIDQAVSKADLNAIKGEISVAPELLEKLNNKPATLFIFARADQGPPMPVAATRLSAVTFPYHYSLDDSHSLSQERKLSSTPRLIIGARLSFSGNATPQAGDIEGFSQIVSADKASNANVVIDTIRQ